MVLNPQPAYIFNSTVSTCVMKSKLPDTKHTLLKRAILTGFKPDDEILLKQEKYQISLTSTFIKENYSVICEPVRNSNLLAFLIN
jgi:hypothetical protein